MLHVKDTTQLFQLSSATLIAYKAQSQTFSHIKPGGNAALNGRQCSATNPFRITL